MMYKVTWAFPPEETLFDGKVIKPLHSCILFKNKDRAYKLWRELPRNAALTKISHEEAAAIKREKSERRRLQSEEWLRLSRLNPVQHDLFEVELP